MQRHAATLWMAVLTMAFTSSQLHSQGDVTKLKKTLESYGATLVKATIDNDLETVMSFYADDVISMPNYGKVALGRAAVRAGQEKMKKEGVKFTSMNFKILKVWTAGDYVFELGTYALSLTTPAAPYPVAEQGKYMTTWQRQKDGSLKVKAEIWNTDLNPWKMMQKHE